MQPISPRFTDTQGQYLAFIATYVKLHRQAPAEADFVAFFRVTPPTVHRMIVMLTDRGLIHRDPGRPRSIRLLVDAAHIPLLQ